VQGALVDVVGNKKYQQSANAFFSTDNFQLTIFSHKSDFHPPCKHVLPKGQFSIPIQHLPSMEFRNNARCNHVLYCQCKHHHWMMHDDGVFDFYEFS
jgi:hypothetical protein